MGGAAVPREKGRGAQIYLWFGIHLGYFEGKAY